MKLHLQAQLFVYCAHTSRPEVGLLPSFKTFTMSRFHLKVSHSQEQVDLL